MAQLSGQFSFEELFFSRTDQLGKIIAGNNVFQRVSVFEWNELIGRPHNIVRHEDMPRSVFYIFWEMLKQQKPVGAYVKNKTKDGSFYWVFALALPIDGEFISIRFKPSSPTLDIVKDLYKEILQEEQVNKIQPKAGAEKILQKLNQLGFANYEDFMRESLLAELNSREVQRGRKIDEGIISNLSALLQAGRSVAEASRTIFDEYAKNMYISLNLNIEANHMGDKGTSMAKVAEQFQKMIEEIQQEIKTFTEIAEKTNNSLKDNQLLVCAAKLQKEMIDFFKTEAKNEYINSVDESVILDKLSKDYRLKVTESLKKMVITVDELGKSVGNLLHMVNGLEIVRITGKIESARTSDSMRIFESLLNELKQFVDILKKGLTDIQRSSHMMSGKSRSLLQELNI